MNETLQGMVQQNFFTRIAVAAVNQKTQGMQGMQQLSALYLAMGWISGEEAAEVIGYAQEKLMAA
jgi:hypothetical protein